MNRKSLFFIVVTLFIILSCKKNNDDPAVDTPAFDQSGLLLNWSDRVITPAYTAYAEACTDYQTAVIGLSATSEAADWNQAKAAHHKAYLAWQKVGLFEFGPAADLVLRANTNTYPTDTAEVNQKMKENDLSLEGASLLDAKGFPAADYLLFGGGLGPNFEGLPYLKTVVEELANNSSAVAEKWNTYAATFKEGTGTDVGSSLGMVVNAMNLHLERYHREGKIGIPNGERSFSGEPLPGHVEGTYEGSHSLAYAEANLRMVEALYLGNSANGEGGTGLDDNLNFIDAKHGQQALDQAIKDQFKKCFTAYGALSIPLNEAVVTESDKVTALYTEIQKLVVLLKTDLPSSLGILITYQDNDGD